MSVALSLDGSISLEQIAPGIRDIFIGLGWDQRTADGSTIDLDACVFLLNQAGRVRGDYDLIFYNQPKSQCGSIQHMGDNRTGEGQGDDESVRVSFPSIPYDIDRIVIAVTIHNTGNHNHSFSQVYDSFIRIINAATNQEICRYDLTQSFGSETALVFGELYRNNGEWRFRPVCRGYQGGLTALAQNYGINLG